MAESRYLTAPLEQKTMPKGIPFIVGNEAAERFSFYGMKAILMVFMTTYMLNGAGEKDVMEVGTATLWVANFNSAVYLFPIFGAILADWLFGKYRMIMLVSLLYCAGHGVLTLMDLNTGIHQRDLLFWGLCMIALGAGGIKPCVSAHVGDQFGKANSHLISTVFGWFYFSINFGAMFSTMLTPLLLKDPRFGPTWAFGIPGVLMTLATLIFWLGRNRYVHVPPAGHGYFQRTFSEEGRKAILNLVPLLLLLAPFWSLLDQTQSRWVDQAKRMDRNIFSWTIDEAQVQAVNPIFVMLFIPLFTYVVYPYVRRFVNLTPLRLTGFGFLLGITSYLIVTWIETRLVAGETPSILWQILAYGIITAAEVMVYITTLEFSYTQAPKEMKSSVMGIYYLSMMLGNQFVAMVNYFMELARNSGTPILQGANYYWFFTITMAVTAVLFVIWAPYYRGRSYIQSDDQTPAGA